MVFYPTEPAPSSSLDSATIRGNFNFLDNTLINHVSASSAHNADAITIDVIGSPVVDNVEDFHDNIFSAGTFCRDMITDDGDGTITVSSGSGLIRTWDNDQAPLVSFEWASSSSIAIGDDALTYVYLDYNGGSPVIKTTTNRNDISDNSEVCIGHVYKEAGILTIHVRTGGLNTCDITRRVDRRIKDLRNFERSSGMVTSETGIRSIGITAGEGWRGLDLFTTSAQNTSGSGDEFTYWYRDGIGGWTKVSGSTQIDNTQYDDGDGGLATLGVGRYGVHWVFLCNDSHIDIVYGQGNYKLAEAQNAEVPSGLSDKINKFDIIIAKIIILRDAATFTEVATAFETFFPRSEVINHNDLGNIDGGTTDEYYHLTDAEHGALVDGGSADGYHTHPKSGSLDTLDSVCERGATTDVAITVDASGSIFTSLLVVEDLQIGEDLEVDGNTVVDGTIIVNTSGSMITSLLIPGDLQVGGNLIADHNTLSNLQGGQANEYYHLEDVEHGALVDGGSADGYHTHPDSGSAGADTLDDVCERGAETDVAITVDASGSIFTSLLVVEDLHVGEEINANGDINSGADIKADGDIYINEDETDADAILHFKTSGSVDETLRWDKTDNRFEFSDDLNVSGSIEDLWDNVVTVSKNSKGDYDTIQAAIDSIADATSTNKYCVYVMPGIYNEQVTVKDSVDIVGIDRGSCVIKYDSGTSLITPQATMECWVINMTLDVDEVGVYYSAHIRGKSIGSERAKVNFRECYFLTTAGTAALFLEGGQAVCMNCVLVSANTLATIRVADGPSNWAGLLTLQNCLVSNAQSGSGYGISFSGNGYVKIDNSRIASTTNEAIDFNHTGDASLTVFNSNLISTSDAVVKVYNGVTAAKCYFKECNLSAGGTNLIDLNSGTGTIGMFNCVIDNNTKPAGLTITSGGPSSNYGDSNIYTAGAPGRQSIEFDVGGLALADGTAGSAAPALSLVTTSDADDPQCRTFCLRFDDTVNEHVFWQCRLPTDYVSGGRFKVQFYNVDAQDNNEREMRPDVCVQAVTPGDATIMTALDIVNDGGGWIGLNQVLNVSSASAARLYESDINMDTYLDGMVAGDFVQWGFRRKVETGDDDAVGDMAVITMTFEYNY